MGLHKTIHICFLNAIDVDTMPISDENKQEIVGILRTLATAASGV
jgi:hypothetical protein